MVKYKIHSKCGLNEVRSYGKWLCPVFLGSGNDSEHVQVTELLEVVVEVQFSCHADKQSPLQVGRELGVVVRQSGVGLSPWTGVGAAVHKKLRAGLESVDEEPHVSAVVLEVEEEVVVHSTGGRIEQNGGKVLVQFSVRSLHNPPHIWWGSQYRDGNYH